MSVWASCPRWQKASAAPTSREQETGKGLCEKIPWPELAGDRFLSVHRSFIVNLVTVRAIERGRIVFGEIRIPVTEQYIDNFRRFLDRNFI
ncbi:MAG: LytTR family transcriptional regulator DNA-binding domain-containing protein [Actinomycetota bacterium]|jgi:hypothetical protein